MDSTSSEIIVSGSLWVDPAEREAYLAGCEDVVRQARARAGCLDFAISPDLLDAGRINVLERWQSQAAVDAFRGDGVSEEQAAQVLGADVREYDVAAERRLA